MKKLHLIFFIFIYTYSHAQGFKLNPKAIDNGKIFLIGDIEATLIKKDDNTTYGLNWNEANEICKKIGDYWRLPTKDELEKIYLENKKRNLFFNSYYWSSSKDENLNVAWTLDFFNGAINSYSRNVKNYVIAVRNFIDLGVFKYSEDSEDFKKLTNQYLESNKAISSEQGEFETEDEYNKRILKFKEGLADLRKDYFKKLENDKLKKIELEKKQKLEDEGNRKNAIFKSIQPIDLKIIEISR